MVCQHHVSDSFADKDVGVQFAIQHIDNNPEVLRTVATWSHVTWQSDFPHDTVDTYLNLFHHAISSGEELPCVFVAYDESHHPIGTVTLIDDDELPQATEPGPWLAALYVLPEFREKGVGTALVHKVLEHARHLNHSQVFLYTEDKVQWYESMGWQIVRNALLSNHQVTVLRHLL